MKIEITKMTFFNSIYFKLTSYEVKVLINSFSKVGQFYVILMTKVIAWLKILARNFHLSEKTFKR
jgi:hypothetical protein